MKVSTSVSLSFLCFLLVVTETSAWSMGSIFGNLMFAVSGCMNKEYTTDNCLPIKNGPAKNHYFWDNVCSTSSSRRRLSTSTQWTVEACAKQHGGNLVACSNYAVEYCSEEYVEDSAEYSNYDASNAGENSISSGTISSSKTSFLPYIIAATVATIFLGLFVWKKRVSEIISIV
jgi:hypothetical protein